MELPLRERLLAAIVALPFSVTMAALLSVRVTEEAVMLLSPTVELVSVTLREPVESAADKVEALVVTV